MTSAIVTCPIADIYEDLKALVANIAGDTIAKNLKYSDILKVLSLWFGN